MPVTDVIIDQGATATAKGGMVFNVKAYGALGTALANPAQNDTAAFQAVITAASAVMGTVSETATSARGGVVFVPHGVYRITSTLRLPSGVSIRGAGMRTTQLIIEVGTTNDGLAWNLGSETPYRVGGFLEDIDIKSGTAVGVRDLVVLDTWDSFAFHRVRLYAASRYNLNINGGINITADHLASTNAGVSCLYINPTGGVTTTTRFENCYFQETLTGPCVDVAGLGLSFVNCVFESSGRSDLAQGNGARVRWGTATFLAPYFENNSNWELISGTQDRPVGENRDTSVVVLNPIVRFGLNPDESYRKRQDGGGFRFERGSAVLLGGDLAGIWNPVVLTPTTGHVFISANTNPYIPVMMGGSGSLADAQGVVVYGDTATGESILTGRPGHVIGGGTLISRHVSITPGNWATGVVPHGGVAATTFSNLMDVELGDTVVVAGRHLGGAFPPGVLFFAAAGTYSITVTMLNQTGGTLNNLVAQLRLDVWKH